MTIAELPDVPYVLRNTAGDRRRWQCFSRKQRAATTETFARWLVDVARVCRPGGVAELQ